MLTEHNNISPDQINDSDLIIWTTMLQNMLDDVVAVLVLHQAVCVLM